MKAFLEEYGMIIVVIIVVAVLIALAVYFSKKGRKDISETYEGFTKGAQTIVNSAIEDAGSLTNEVSPTDPTDTVTDP